MRVTGCGDAGSKPIASIKDGHAATARLIADAAGSGRVLVVGQAIPNANPDPVGSRRGEGS